MSLKKANDKLRLLEQQKKALEKALEDEKRKNGELEEKVRKQAEVIQAKDLKIKKLEAPQSLAIQKLRALKLKVDTFPGGTALQTVKQEGRRDDGEEGPDDRNGVELKPDLRQVKAEGGEEEETDVDE